MTVFEGFIGQSYQSRSLNFDAQRTVNLMPQKSEVGDSKSINALASTPGLKTFITLSGRSLRGSHQCLGRAFAVAGNTLYEVFSDGSSATLGTLLTLNGTVAMEDNGRQLCAVDGDNKYVYTFSPAAFTTNTGDGWLGSYTVSEIDGYFIFVEPNSGIVYISGLYDGNSIDPLDEATAEARPDNLVATLNVRNQLWLLGVESTQVSTDTGDVFPFTPIPGAIIQYGCAAAQSARVSANTAFWLGNDADGACTVWMATGLSSTQRISTFAIEFRISQSTDISGAVAYTYMEEGHYFYCLNVPGLDTTLCYDVNIGEWHERGYWSKGKYSRHLADNHIFVFGKHLVGDYNSGKLYEQSQNIYDDAGNEKRWMRTCAHIADPNELDYIFYHRMQIDMQTGVGLTNNPSAKQLDSDPQVALSWSSDGGYSYSNEHWRPAGKVGQYLVRAIWRQLGRGRDRVFKAVGTAACRFFLIGANIETTHGDN